MIHTCNYLADELSQNHPVKSDGDEVPTIVRLLMLTISDEDLPPPPSQKREGRFTCCPMTSVHTRDRLICLFVLRQTKKSTAGEFHATKDEEEEDKERKRKQKRH